MGEEICKFISGSPSKLSSRWFSFSWAYSGRIFLCWRPEFYYLISVAPFVVSFFWGANLHCFLLLVCHLWFLGTQEKNRQAVSLSGACQDPNAYFLFIIS